MNEHDKATEPHSERIKKCPIHQWADVDGYLEAAQVPHHLWEPFHEVVLARGKYPWKISEDDNRVFASEAYQITIKYEVKPDEGYSFMMMFQQLINQWIEDRRAM